MQVSSTSSHLWGSGDSQKVLFLELTEPIISSVTAWILQVGGSSSAHSLFMGYDKVDIRKYKYQLFVIGPD